MVLCFLVAQIFNIFGGCLIFLISFWGSVYAWPKPTYDEEMRDFFDRLDSEKRTY